MASVASPRRQRYARWAMRASYDPNVDIALVVLERGTAVTEERPWGLIDRDPADHHLIGFEIWDASHRLPPDLINALSGTSTRKAD
jgi:uncharacterized protein YuzE